MGPKMSPAPPPLPIRADPEVPEPTAEELARARRNRRKRITRDDLIIESGIRIPGNPGDGLVIPPAS